jgi:hypothetical protein
MFLNSILIELTSPKSTSYLIIFGLSAIHGPKLYHTRRSKEIRLGMFWYRTLAKNLLTQRRKIVLVGIHTLEGPEFQTYYTSGCYTPR